MKNELISIIIKNPGNKNFLYKTRDGLLFIITTYIWGAILINLYLVMLGGLQLDNFLSDIILKIFASGFIISFLFFHCWAIYNIHRYHSVNRKNFQKTFPQEPTINFSLQENYSLKSKLTDA